MPTSRSAPGRDAVTTLNLVEAIRSAIRGGRLAPGQRLIEAELATEFRSTRARVRDALAKLHGQGLVVLEANRGARVRRLSPEDVRQLYQVREMLEGLAARMCAARHGERAFAERLTALRADLRKIADDPDVPSFLRLNEAFHRFILEQAGNGFVVSFMGQLAMPVFRVQYEMILTRETLRQSAEDHDAICAAILAGDGDKAEAIMRRHVRNSYVLVRDIDAAEALG